MPFLRVEDQSFRPVMSRKMAFFQDSENSPYRELVWRVFAELKVLRSVVEFARV